MTPQKDKVTTDPIGAAVLILLLAVLGLVGGLTMMALFGEAALWPWLGLYGLGVWVVLRGAYP